MTNQRSVVRTRRNSTLQGEEVSTIAPVGYRGGLADEDQIRNCSPERNIVRDEYHPGGSLATLDERGMLGGHGVDIPCHQKPPLGGRPGIGILIEE